MELSTFILYNMPLYLDDYCQCANGDLTIFPQIMRQWSYRTMYKLIHKLASVNVEHVNMIYNIISAYYEILDIYPSLVNFMNYVKYYKCIFNPRYINWQNDNVILKLLKINMHVGYIDVSLPMSNMYINKHICNEPFPILEYAGHVNKKYLYLLDKIDLSNTRFRFRRSVDYFKTKEMNQINYEIINEYDYNYEFLGIMNNYTDRFKHCGGKITGFVDHI